MTTLMKSKKRKRLTPFDNRLLTPWRNNLMRPWNNRLFPSYFDDFNNLMRFDDIFKDDFFEDDSLLPAMNIREHKDNFEIEFAAPGFTKKDFEVTIEKDVLHVCGEKEFEEEEKDDDFARKEFNYKSFKRSMMLPPSVDLDQDVKASYKSGILKVKLLKREDVIKQEPPKKVIDVE